MTNYRILLCLAPMLLAGCVSYVSSEKLEPGSNTKGLRYSLPQPFLLVTPKSDGTMDVERIYLPDPNRSYTLRQTAILANHTLDVTMQNGMLKSVTMNADATALPSELIGAMAELEKLKIETEAGQLKSQADTGKAAQKRLIDAQAALAKAQTLVDYLTSLDAASPGNEAIQAELLKANIALVQAQAELAAAQESAASLGLALNGAGLNVAQGTPSGAWGPVLYRVVQPEEGGVELHAINFATSGAGEPQLDIPTSRLALPPADSPPVPATIPASKIVTEENRIFGFATTVKVTNYDESKSTFERKVDSSSLETVTPFPAVVPTGTNNQWEVGLPPELAPGTYFLNLYFEFGNLGPQSMEIVIKKID